MAFVVLAPILNIWLADGENKVEILISPFITERSDLVDIGIYGGRKAATAAEALLEDQKEDREDLADQSRLGRRL
jgi:hypothetical protein